jgi:hypothetical protein
MIPSNVDRNRVIFELWEQNLTVDEISSRTGIPRGTVGYYVRKFNRLAVEGKPIVFLKKPKVESEPRGSPFSEFIELMSEMAIRQVRTNILRMLSDQKYEELYYLLMDLKLISQLDSFVTLETFKKAVGSTKL